MFDVIDNLRIKSMYNFDLDVKKLNYLKINFEGK